MPADTSLDKIKAAKKKTSSSAVVAAAGSTMLSTSGPSGAINGTSTSTSLLHARPALVAATLANAELTAAKASSDLYYDKFRATDEENVRLREGLTQQETDALLVIRRLETQLMEAFEDASAFKQSVSERLAQQATAEQQLVAHYEELLEDRDRTIADFAALVSRLQDDLRQASRFVQQRQEHQQELQQLHNTMEEMIMSHERETAAMRFQSVDRKMKLVALERTMREEFQAMVDKESRRLLEAKHGALLAHNNALERDKQGLVRDIDDLLALTTKINSERTDMKRVSELHRTAHEEVLRHTVARNRQSREAELKVQRLEARVRTLTAELASTKKDLRAQYEGTIADLTAQLTAAQNANVVLQSELKSMRALAGKVVEQRTDLERFFYLALEDCRRYRTVSATAAASSTASTTLGHGDKSHRTTMAATAIAKPRGAASMAGTTRTPRPPFASSTGQGSSTHARAGALAHTIPAHVATTATATALVGPLDSNAAGDTFRLTQPTLVDATKASSSTPPPETVAVAAAAGGTAKRAVQLPPVKPATVAPPVAALATAPPPLSDVSAASIDSLAWEDKERVIKALFFYINASYYKAPAPVAT